MGAIPGRFLSTVQIGITLIGIIAGAYSGSSLGATNRTTHCDAVGSRTRNLPERLVLHVVIGLTTYISLIVGELVPKQFALRAPEPIAAVSFASRWSG